ncbi:uncharacterized protein LOC144744354 [Ciona intestinalis]
MGVVKLAWFVVVWLFISQTTDASFRNYSSNNGMFLYTCGVTLHLFTEAVELCEKANAQLAVLNTEEMLNGAMQVFSKCGQSFYWVGLRRNESTGDQYRWLDGSGFNSGQVGGRIIKYNDTSGCVGVALQRPDILLATVCTGLYHVLCFTTQNISTITTRTETTVAATTYNPTSTHPILATTASPTSTKPTTDVQTSTNEQTVALPTSSPMQAWLIIVIVILVISFLIFLVVTLYCCWWKKRNQASGKSNGTRNRPAERFQPYQLDRLHTYENAGPVQPPVETPYCNVQPSTNEDAYEIFDLGRPK